MHITYRQQQCLDKLLDGFTTHQIAQVLKISPRTVQVHLDTLRKELKAANLHHLVAIAFRKGLVR